MKKRYLIFFIFFLVIVTALVLVMSSRKTYAYYQTGITGAVNAATSSYAGEVEIVSSTHVFLPAEDEEVDEISFYIKNYTGSDQNPTAISQVYMAYSITFTPPTWANECENPVSYKLYSINETTNAETEVTLTNNTTGDINFSLLSSEKDFYKLKVYWDTTNNSATCYAGKTGSVSIDAVLKQRNV